MRFRWKLLILLLAVSIVPIVGLRTFGIHNVRIMSKALIAQVELNQEREVKSRLLMLMEGYSGILGKIREEVEMALAFQMFEVKRGILQNHPRGLQNILSGEKDVELPEEKKTYLPPDFVGPAKDDPNAAKVGGLQSQGVKGENVVGYLDPLTTQDLKSSGFPVG